MGLHEDVKAFVESVAASPLSIFTSQSLSHAFLEQKNADGEWLEVQGEQRNAEYLGVQQIVRDALRGKYDAEGEPDEGQLSIDLPEEYLLQARYSVGRRGEEKYVPRALLTAYQVEQIATRLEQLSVHYARHAQALRAAWHREHSAIAANE
jgi:hypothetical protein